MRLSLVEFIRFLVALISRMSPTTLLITSTKGFIGMSPT